MIVVESGFTGINWPLTHPRIGARPVSGDISASTSAAGFDAEFAADPDTGKWWRPTAVPATWAMEFPSAQISYVGIAAHDMGTVGATVEVERWNGAAWITVVTHAPADDRPIFCLLAPRDLDRIRLRFTGAVPTIGIIYAGAVTEFPQKSTYVGSVTFDRAVQDEYSTPVSDGGQWLGRYVTRRSVPAKMEVSDLSEAWAAAVLDPLLLDLRGRPVFIADRPFDYPQSLVFAYTTGPVVPERTRANRSNSISVTFEVTGHA